MFNKKQIAMIGLSKDLLAYQTGDRIDTISSYTESYDTSRGVVQEAFNTLEDEKAIKRSKRGTLGTYLTEIDYIKLWKYTLETISGVSPLPYTKKHEGIATAIYKEMEKNEIPFHFAYMQGAENRIQGVITGKYNFAILSKSAAVELVKDYDVSIAMEFADYSYLSGYVYLYTDENVFDRKKLRVGRDLSSPDHTKWMEILAREKEIEVEYIDIQYTRMVPAIIEGKIDLTIYNKDTVDKPGIFTGVSFREVEANPGIGDECRAVLVVSNEFPGISNLLKQIIDDKEVALVQQEVIEGKRVPVY